MFRMTTASPTDRSTLGTLGVCLFAGDKPFGLACLSRETVGFAISPLGRPPSPPNDEEEEHRDDIRHPNRSVRSVFHTIPPLLL